MHGLFISIDDKLERREEQRFSWNSLLFPITYHDEETRCANESSCMPSTLFLRVIREGIKNRFIGDEQIGNDQGRGNFIGRHTAKGGESMIAAEIKPAIRCPPLSDGLESISTQPVGGVVVYESDFPQGCIDDHLG